MNEQEIQAKAIEFAKKNKKHIASRLTDKTKYLSEDNAVSVFMAGSPGAGKTEFSKNLMSLLEKENTQKVVRIDGDEIRSLIPGYTGNNSYLFQAAISIIVEKMYDCVLAQKQSCILDGTLSQYDKAVQNIERSINKKRKVFIFYVYQKPEAAWEFTKAREEKEGRNIPKESFIDQFFGARETVKRLRQKFGGELTCFLVKKNYQTNAVEKIVEMKQKSKDIDHYINERYTKNQLQKLL